MMLANVLLSAMLGAVAVFQNDAVKISFDERGRLASIRERVSGRELVATAVPMVSVTRVDGQVLSIADFTAADETLTYEFPNLGKVVLSVTPFAGGWTFAVRECTVPKVKALTFARIMPACTKWEGDFVNGMSDEQSGVILRAYELKTEMYCNGSMGLSSYGSNSGVYPQRDDLGLRLTCEMPERGLVGLRGGLVAGPRAMLIPALRAMTLATGESHTEWGGAWSLGSDGVRRSYLFADLAAAATDDWIELARRAGLGTIHLHLWWQWLGHYYLRREFFPGGLAEMKSVVERIHAAGLKAGIHTLSGSIDPEFDPWIRPVPSQDLLSVATYTLSKPLAAESTELFVNELPVARHDFVYTYRSSGNTLKVGDELIDYTGLSREKPYRFTGLKRGAFGTRAASHAAGERCDYLRQRYLAFYPDPEKPLMRELAGCISNVYATCGFNQIYFDGSEGSGTRWATDLTRRTLFASLDQSHGPVLVEGSCRGPHNWWFMSRYGASDLPFWGAKRFHDRHIRNVIELGCQANFLAPQFGWWSPRAPSAEGRGFFVDETEYFAGKNAGWDAASSIIGADVTKGPLTWGQLRQLTVNGWYERPRLAQAFRPEIRKRLRGERQEFRLRQDRDGIWRLSPVTMNVHRVANAYSRQWQVQSTAKRPAAIRIEALSAPVDAEYEQAPTLIAAKDLGRFEASERTERKFAFSAPYRDLEGRLGFGLKIKGDSSGALFNVQFVGTREYGRSLSEHYVKLDFTGWRYFSFLERERDSRLADDYDWPYDTCDQVCGTPLDTNHLGGVSFWLNAIPTGKTAAVEISDLRLLHEEFPELKGAALTINDKRLPLPFTLQAGEYAELEDGYWTHFDAQGEPLARQAALMPELQSGINELSWTGGRAEVSVTALDEGEPALVSPLTAAMKSGMDYEACAPYAYAPAKGFDSPLTVAIRPKESARIRVRATGGSDAATVESVELTNDHGQKMILSVPGQTEPLTGTWSLRPLGNAIDAKIEVVKLYDCEDEPFSGAISSEATAQCEEYVRTARRLYATSDFADYRTSIVTQWVGAAEVDSDRQYRQPAAGTVRWIHVDGTANFRDIGGWTGLKTGLVYRGAEPNCHTNSTKKVKPGRRGEHDLYATAAGLKTLSETMKIRTDLDLRSPRESPTPEATPIPGARLCRIPLSSYTNCLQRGKGKLAQALRVFAKRENYPIYFHCYGGADRTGTLALVLEGLCGVCEADLNVDYELTSFGLGRRPRYDCGYFFASTIAILKRYPGDTLKDRIANYVEHELGLSPSEIASIREILMDGSEPK